MNRIERCYQDFVRRNREDLMKEYGAYSSNPNVDYCVGECNHAHTFDAYARREFAEYRRQIQDDAQSRTV